MILHMLAAPKNLKFIKANGLGNDFVIFDARLAEVNLSVAQIQKISNRKNIGCDQLIIIKKASQNFDCEMVIYNCDGSLSGACGNATRCVAGIIFEDSSKAEIFIKTAAGILACKKDGDLISVNMGKMNFGKNIELFGFDFFTADIGNQHAVTFIKENISDAKFFEISPQIENHNFFPNKTNVEFAKIINDDLIEVRVFERAAGETLACGSGACAVGAVAIKNSLIKKSQTIIRFKGGDLKIEKLVDDSVIMTGAYEKVFDGEIDREFLK